MDYSTDKRTVMTLDAGGTNLVFTAIRGNEQVIDAITLPTHGDNLDKCLSSIIEGFQRITSQLQTRPVAISFAFPGPADYPTGIIGDLPNLPAFRGGVALGPMLTEKFGIPVFINNDGDLYAYGEAIAGYLPYVNTLLEKAGCTKRYKNLLGITLGTGFGAGIVRDGNLFLGDNSNAGDIWRFRDKLLPLMNVEAHASIAGIKRTYASETGTVLERSPEPKEIYEIAKAKRRGDQRAAVKAFTALAESAGNAIAHAAALVDGIVVLGGGLAGAADVFLPLLVSEMNSEFTTISGERFRKVAAKVFNLEDENEIKKFLQRNVKEIPVYLTDKKVKYDSEPRIGIGVTKIGTSKAICIGAYTFALKALDKGKML